MNDMSRINIYVLLCNPNPTPLIHGVTASTDKDAKDRWRQVTLRGFP